MARKDAMVLARVTSFELSKLETIASRNRVTVSEVIRQLLARADVNQAMIRQGRKPQAIAGSTPSTERRGHR